jgi:Uma2 family endonuclease
MATATRYVAPAEETDQRMLVNGVRWKDYVILREALDTPGLRMTYLNGMLEIMSPSRKHERYKTTIARLIELYALMRDRPLNGYGGTTFRQEAKERGAEPDECYACARIMNDGEFPDVVLEVIQTNPLLDKLEVYRGFGVSEVWLFRNEEFELYRLVDEAYVRVDRSSFLPDLDFAVVAKLAVREDQHAALRELRDLLAAER